VDHRTTNVMPAVMKSRIPAQIVVSAIAELAGQSEISRLESRRDTGRTVHERD
jgi:hypothetical protein